MNILGAALEQRASCTAKSEVTTGRRSRYRDGPKSEMGGDPTQGYFA